MTELLQSFGFPVACVICLGGYIARVQFEQRVDSKQREERLYASLEESSKTNKLLLETNAVIVKEIDKKLDMLVSRP